MGQGQYGIDPDTVLRVCHGVKTAQQQGTQIVIVVGGGNIFRGIQGTKLGIPEATAHHMGMLATVMNGLAMRESFRSIGVNALTLSALPLDSLCPSYARWRALEALQNGEVVICVAGTGNPFFTTDTGAVLRAIELDCDATFKATQVDGVYNKDPNKFEDAKRFEEITYTQVLRDDLKVMDGTAIALARDNHLPVIIFNLKDATEIANIVKGDGLYTMVKGG